jgi:hypothetical protein
VFCVYSCNFFSKLLFAVGMEAHGRLSDSILKKKKKTTLAWVYIKELTKLKRNKYGLFYIFYESPRERTRYSPPVVVQNLLGQVVDS